MRTCYNQVTYSHQLGSDSFSLDMFPMLDTLNVTPPDNTTDDRSLWKYFDFIRTTLEHSSPSRLRKLFLGSMVGENRYSCDSVLGIAREILPEVHTTLSESQSFPCLHYVGLSLTLSIKMRYWEDYESMEKSFADLMPTVDESGPTFNVAGLSEMVNTFLLLDPDPEC